MLKIDFGQSLNDHKALLILVKPVGYIGEKSFANVFREISQYSRAQVPNTTRTLYLKYAQHISPQFIEWSTFHSHRRVLGLICVAKCSDSKETEKLCGRIKDLKSEFNSTLLDSRCLVIGCKVEDGATTKKDFVFLDEDKSSEEIQLNMAEFVASLFNVLESKRISKIAEKSDKVAPIHAPVEIDTYSNGEDNRNHKRKSIGRSKKYIGDLSMLTGLHQDAFLQYSLSVEHLRNVSDFLWLAGAIEGQCASTVAIGNTPVDDSSSRFLILPTDCAAKTANVTSNGFGNDFDEAKLKNSVPFSCEELVEKLSEALFLYGRIKGASVVEVEAHYKLTRFLITQKRTIEASIALQNALSVNVAAISDQEKIQRYSSAAQLYKELGFHRKSAFFTRVAAMQCVSQSLPSQGWSASYSLLLQAIKGYNINLDPQEFLKAHPNGWPALQIRLLHELVYTARRLGDPSLAVRHMSFLLHTMQDHLTNAELNDIASGLESLAKQCAGSTSAGIVNNKLSAHSFPEVSLAKMPLVRSFKVHQLAMHLKPVGRKKASAGDSPPHGPFIFSSLRRNPKEQTKKKNILWVQGEIGQVSMEIHNTMPFELKVNKMVLCIEGATFEPYPACLSLPPKTGPHSVMLLGIPHSTGTLKITGYTINVLGTESTCPLTRDSMESKDDFPVTVDVVGYMPLLEVSTPLPKVRSAPTDLDSPQSAPLVSAVTLYAGQSMTGKISLENIGKKAIESIVINLGSDLAEGAHDIFSFDKDEVNSCLPLEPGRSASISVNITGVYHMPAGIGSSDSLSYDPEAPWGLKGIIQFRYSGELDKDHLCRRVSMTIDVSVVPSLHCHNYELRSIPNDESQCLLLFDAENKTSNDMELECGVQPHTDLGRHPTTETLSIQGNDSKRISIYLPRFILPGNGDEDKKLSEEDRRLKYSEVVKNLVKLFWRLPACQVSGFGYIDNFKLTNDMLQLIKPELMVFDLIVNDEVYNREKGVSVPLCSTVSINVTISNKGDMKYTGMALRFEPYQDHANGYRATELNGRVSWIGELKSQVKNQIRPGECFHHCCTFVFFYTGEYHVNITCRGLEDHTTATHDDLSKQGDLAACTWSFTPPLKIYVTG